MAHGLRRRFNGGVTLVSQARRMAPSLLQVPSNAEGSRGHLSPKNPRVPLIAQARDIAPDLKPGTPFVYILRLHSGGLYIGCSTDFETRFRDHQSGTACRTTKLDPPDSVLWIEIHPAFSAARRREAQIKKWSRGKKPDYW
jgi:putative endonuclease